MTANGTRQVMDAQGVQRALVRIAHEIVERGHGTANLALVGIRSRGVHIAQRLRRILHEIEGGDPCRSVGRHHVCDDLDRACRIPVRGSIDFPVDGRRTSRHDAFSRTMRRHTRSSTSAGRRPSSRLMIPGPPRSCRSRADYVGKNIPTALQEEVAVRLAEADGTGRHPGRCGGRDGWHSHNVTVGSKDARRGDHRTARLGRIVHKMISSATSRRRRRS
jgi:pyrimidine operon attenuation protein/uracil phosphoribosyltransferase